jgi:hypothetical protein
MTGRLPSEMMGSGWINIVSADQREEVDLKWTEAMAEEREFNEDITLITGEGGKINVNCHTLKMVNHSQKVIGYMAFFTVLV